MVLSLAACGDSKQPAPCSWAATDFCLCGASAPPYRVVSECSAATMGGEPVCCQGKEDCICSRMNCLESAPGSCSCYLGAGSGLRECTGTYCCASGDTCSCGDTSCGANAKQVTRCAAATALCAAGEMRVAKCGG